LVERCAAGNIEFLDRVNKGEAIPLACCGDTLALLGRTYKLLAVAITDTRDTDNADGSTNGGTLAC
jgi:hypothetical protein